MNTELNVPQKIQDAFEKTQKALLSFYQILQKEPQEDRSHIDAAIQRFEFSIELFWKLLKRILNEKGVDVRFPKDVLQEAFAGHYIDQETLWLDMLNDRNQTSHTYDEKLADQIYEHLFIYQPLMQKTFDLLKNKLYPEASPCPKN